MRGSILIVIGLLVGSSLGFYEEGGDVVVLTESNFKSQVIQSSEVWLVEFFAPWCGHCQRLTPEWKKAASILRGAVKVGAIDADKYRSIGGQYGVKGFPTIKIFGEDKQNPKDFKGSRTAPVLVESAMGALTDMVNGKLGGGGQKKSGGGGGGSEGTGGSDEVVTLTDANFKELVIDSRDPWMVEFFAPWCGHCKSLAPHWAKAAGEMKGKVKFGALDATVHQSTAQQYGIQGFPTIKFFPAGSKTWSSAEDYNGGRTSQDLVDYANQKWSVSLPPPEVYQLIQQQILDDCTSRQLCVISFLPHILDTGAEQRNKFIAVLKAQAEYFKQRDFGWVWSEAGSALQLEEAVGVGGFGYPAQIALNKRKKSYATLTGPFSEAGIQEFLRDLVGGRSRHAVLKGETVPEVDTIEPWDGKDGELPIEDDIDLSDFDMDADQKEEL